MRETREEVGITVAAIKPLAERVHPASGIRHPATGRTMVYVACKVLGGRPYVAGEEGLAEVEWCDRAKLTSYVPYPFFGPVEEYFAATLT